MAQRGRRLPRAVRLLILFVGVGVVGILGYRPVSRIPASGVASLPTLTISLPDAQACSSIVISPDGSHAAYVLSANGGKTVHLDGKPLARHSKIRVPWEELRDGCLPQLLPGLFFSPDGRRLAYAVARGKQWAMVVDGKPGTAYDELGAPIFSSKGRRIAYTARTGRRWQVVVDGSEADRSFSAIGAGRGLRGDPTVLDPIFSTDGKHLAYVAITQTTIGFDYYLVKDGQKIGPYTEISDLTFSTNWARYAFRAGIADGKQVIVDTGKAQPAFAALSAPALSADGRHLAYSALNDRRSPVLIRDGKLQSCSGDRRLRTPIFSPDGKQLVTLITGKEGQDGLVRDGVVVAWAGESPRDGIYTVTFSPDSRRLAYLTHEALVVVDEGRQPGIPHDWRFVFSPDSRHLAYTVAVPDGVVPMRDGVPLIAPVEEVNSLTFSPDSVHLLYSIRQKSAGRAQCYPCIDAARGTAFEKIFPDFYFPVPDQYYYYGYTAGQLHRVMTLISAAEEGRERTHIRQMVAQIMAPGVSAIRRRELSQQLTHAQDLVYAGDVLLAAAELASPMAFDDLAATLGGLHEKRAVPMLIRQLAKDDWEWSAARTLGEIGDPRAVPPLLSAMSRKHKPARSMIASALGKLRDRRAVAPLLAYLQESPDDIAQVEIIRALGEIGDPLVVSVLISRLNDPKKIDEEEYVAREIANTLHILTGQSFGEDGTRWQAWQEGSRPTAK